MPKSAVLKIEADLVNGINSFLRILLGKDILEAILVPLELPSQDMVVAALVSDPEMLRSAHPLAPVMQVSMARVVSGMTKLAPSQKKVGVVLRSCELRALIELVKLKQASLENLVLIGIDCYGTYSVANYKELYRGKAITAEELTNISADPRLREACQVCEYPAPLNADLVIGLVGVDLDKNILVKATSPEGERILEALELDESDGEQEKKRESALSEMIASRTKRKDELFHQYQGELTGLDNLLSTFASCINCRNCRIACPLCYCKECFFDSPTFEWEADKYLGWASKRGALRMPTDSLLFHLTRLNHMVASCVGCGLCQEACPNDINVFPIFRMVGEEVQKSFDYVPGRSLEEALPLSVFREDELGEVGV